MTKTIGIAGAQRLREDWARADRRRQADLRQAEERLIAPFTVQEAIGPIREALQHHTFRSPGEAGLQLLVAELLEFGKFRSSVDRVLGTKPLGPPATREFYVQREVISSRNRYDIVVDHVVRGRTARCVLELKMAGSAESAERQAQRYAKSAGVDAVVVVTTLKMLASKLCSGRSDDWRDDATWKLGDRPFSVILLNTAI